MNILIVTAWWPNSELPFSGIFIAEQARLLARHHSVKVIRLTYPRWRGTPKCWMAERSSQVDKNGVSIFYEPVLLPARFKRMGALSATAAYSRGREKACQDGWRPDVIHAHNVLPAGLAAVRGERNHQCPVVITEHRSTFANDLLDSFSKSLVEEAAKGASAFLAVGSTLAALMGQVIDPSKIKVIGNVVDTGLFVPPAKPPAAKAHALGLKWFSLALLGAGKGMAELIEAFSAHAVKYPQATLSIGGDGPERKTLENLAFELNMGKKINFLGPLNQEKVIHNLHRSDAFILASHTETFGLVYAEAMACGLPVVATSCGGPQDFVTDAAGVMTTPGSIHGISGAMEKLTDRFITYNPLRIRGQITKKYSPSAYTGRLCHIYEGVQPSLP